MRTTIVAENDTFFHHTNDFELATLPRIDDVLFIKTNGHKYIELKVLYIRRFAYIKPMDELTFNDVEIVVKKIT